MASLKNQSVHTGNTVLISMKNKTIGRAQSLTAERSFNTTGVYEIGSIMPQEHVFLKYEGTVTVNRLRMRSEDFVSAGISPLEEDVLSMGVFDIILADATSEGMDKNNITNAHAIEVYCNCSIDSLNLEVRANEIASEEARFYYLKAFKPNATSKKK